ncbi:MAG: endospore germination permease [Clostridia bacterium]|nr:endospore germination permease [Clostridia bacterium]
MAAQKITGRQLMAVLALARLQAAFVILPVLTSTRAGRDAWLAAVISTPVGLAFALFVIRVAGRYPEGTVVQFARACLGRWLGAAWGLAYAGFFFGLAAVTARVVAESYVLGVMPETPLIVFIVVVVWLGSLAARGGVEVIGRMSESSLFLVLPLLLAAIFLPIARARWENLLPVLEHGPAPVLAASLTSFALYAEVAAAGMLLTHLATPQEAARYTTRAILLSGSLFVLVTVTVTAILGPNADDLVLPVFSQARLISMGRFLERLETLPLAAWTLMVWLKVGFYLWVTATGLAQTFGLADYRPLVYPLGFLAACLAVVGFENIFEVQEFYRPEAWGKYGTILAVGLILLLAGAGRARGKRTRQA